MKILIVKNRYKKKIDISRGLNHLESKTPLKFEVEELETDFDLEFRQVSNKTFKGVVPTNYYDKLRSVIPEGKYNVVCLYYGNKASGIRVSITEKIPLYNDTDVIVVAKETDGGLTWNHEMLHVFPKRLFRLFGIKVPDDMDSYKNNASLTAKDSNREDALKVLKPYWTLLDKKQETNISIVLIERKKKTSKQVTGLLTAVNNGAKFTCSTLELADKNNTPDISCIPSGSYKVIWSLSPRLMKYTYEVLGVPNRSGIRFHSANFFHELKGCIALGDNLVDINKDGELDTINSKKTIDLFNNFMGKKEFTLVIK